MTTFSLTHPYRVRDLIAALSEHDPDLPVEIDIFHQHCCECACDIETTRPLAEVRRPAHNNMDVTIVLSTNAVVP